MASLAVRRSCRSSVSKRIDTRIAAERKKYPENRPMTRIKRQIGVSVSVRSTYLMVVAQQLVQEIDRLIAYEALILRVDKAVPRLLGEAAKDVIVLLVQLDLVLVEIVEQVIGTQHLGDLDELVRVAVAVEEGLLAEDHGGEHGAEAPHVEAVVVLLEVDQQLGALEVARRDADVVLGARVVELGQAPVYQTELLRIE